jgi:hypothetical protein
VITQQQDAIEARDFLLGARQEGPKAGDKIIDLVGLDLDPTGIHAGMHMQLLS